MARYSSANDIINRAALECGLQPTGEPVGSTDETFTQLTGLLTSAGQELIELFPWQAQVKEYAIQTQDGDSGDYDLPDDFCYMINQTGWDQGNNLPIGGPLSAQAWTYLAGRDLVSQTIYASFRLKDNKISLFPQPPPADMDITFEYISRDWVATAPGTVANQDFIGAGNDIVLYETILIVKFLKCKFLEAKNLPVEAARLEFENMMNSRMGKDKGAPVLSASRSFRGAPLITPFTNTGDTGYGL